MIRALRKKFILVTMLSVTAVLFVIVLTVNIWNVRQNTASLDTISGMLAENGGVFPGLDKNPVNDKGEPHMPGNGQGTAHRYNIDDRLQNNAELPFATRFFSIQYDSGKTMMNLNLKNTVSVTEAEAIQYADAVFEKNADTGWYKSFRYRIEQTDSGYIVVMIEATTTQVTIRSVWFITIVVALVALAVILLLVTFFSGRVLAPVADAYRKQKQFITDAGHELKTPLTVIAANTEILGMTYGENEWSNGIARQTEQMRSLIGQMIRMSRLDEEDQHPAFEMFSLGDAVYDTAMSFSGPAAARGLTLTADVPSHLMYKGDEASIRQVVSILVDNAVKYCDSGGEIHVSLTCVKELGREHPILSVTNTFAAAHTLDTERVFERFYRADKARTTSNSYGLGLSIAKSILEQHSASIRAIAHENAVEFRARF